MSLILPQELLDTIIDFLHADYVSLRACALSCRPCLASARCHLFSDVIITSANFRHFLNLVESTSHISPLIHDITIKGSIWGARHQSSEADIFLAENISRATVSLHALVSLRLFAVDWDLFVFETVLRSLMETIPHIRNLDLCCLKFRSFNQVIDFVCAFQSLQHLSMKLISWDSHNSLHSVQSLRRTCPIRVEVGQINSRQSQPLFKWLLSQDPPPRLYSFFIRVPDNAGRSIIREVCESPIASYVNILHISLHRSISEMFGGDDTLHAFGLEHCVNLRTLHFHTPLLGYAPGLTRRREWIPMILKQVTSFSVEEVVFRIEIQGYYDSLRFDEHGRQLNKITEAGERLDQFDWSGVTDVLLDAQFSQLKKVSVIVRCDERWYEDMAVLIKHEKFSVFHSHGILCIEHRVDDWRLIEKYQ